jgi:outer membrane protein assembly factor BamB
VNLRATVQPLAKAELVWSHEIGEGHASPISDGEQIYTFTREGDLEVTRAIARLDGREIWRRELRTEEPKIGFAARSHGRGPKSTPTWVSATAEHPALLVTWGMTGVLTVREAQGGKLVWNRELTDFSDSTPSFGVASSPLVLGERIVLAAGGEEGGALVALDLLRGTELWRTALAVAYSSPVRFRSAGADQVVLLALDQVVGVSADDGKLLWSHPYPGKGYAQDVMTPLVIGDAVLISGEKRPTTLLRPTVGPTGWTADVVWTNEDSSVEMSSPVVLGPTIFLHSHLNKGSFVALASESGDTTWASPPRAGEHASLLGLGSSSVLALDSDALLLLFQRTAGDQWGIALTLQVAESPTWAAPLLLEDGSVVVKDATSLRCWRVLQPLVEESKLSELVAGGAVSGGAIQ